MTETPDRPDRWPRPLGHGVPPEDQDRTVHPVLAPPTEPWASIFLDLVAARDRIYNR